MKYSNNTVSIVALILIALVSWVGIAKSQSDHDRENKPSIGTPQGVR